MPISGHVAAHLNWKIQRARPKEFQLSSNEEASAMKELQRFISVSVAAFLCGPSHQDRYRRVWHPSWTCVLFQKPPENQRNWLSTGHDLCEFWIGLRWSPSQKLLQNYSTYWGCGRTSNETISLSNRTMIYSAEFLIQRLKSHGRRFPFIADKDWIWRLLSDWKWTSDGRWSAV